MDYFVGIDVGSTTVKIVVLDEEERIIYKTYQRHFSKVRETTLKYLKEISNLLANKELKIAITGSAGLGMANDYNINFIQEVIASSIAVKKFYPDTDVVIELGGEDAKILFLKGVMEERMNGSCAGGTGAFIDQMAALMDIDVAKLDELSFKSNKIYKVASRCGVFAKSDVQPLLNQGVSKEDISASIYQAVVEQTITGLAQGKEIKGNVLFLGGPLYFLKGLASRFRTNLNLDEKSGLVPDDGQFFVSLGAALFAKDQKDKILYEDLIKKLEVKKEAKKLESENALFKNKQEYDEFVLRHKKASVNTISLDDYKGNAYLGIDSGSTTLKIVLISENCEILYKFYSSNKANPVELLKEQLIYLYELLKNKDIKIISSGVSGYGEELIKEAFGVDFGLVETMAHYRAARHFNPKVDYIIDIGGQDIKCFSIHNSNIDSIVLNEACSSGCGSFLSSFANSLGYDIKDFAKMALFAPNPSKLGSRCTVFMNSSVKQAQKEGASIEDISAGLAISVIKNAIYKVIRVRSASELGKNIVVQGGTFLNDAVLRAFELELNQNVIRLNISELMGAYGAALFAKDNKKNSSNLIGLEELKNFKHNIKLATCGLCTNKCSLTINIFNNSRFVIGNRCEKGAGKRVSLELANMAEFKRNLLKEIAIKKVSSNFKIGLPMVLNMYEFMPFWKNFFENLGFEVVVSNYSSKESKIKAAATIPSDTVCYPAKISHFHIQNLIDEGVDLIFYPSMSYAKDEGLGDSHFNCPVVAYYPEVLNKNFSLPKEIKFLSPHLSFNNLKIFEKRVYEELSKYLDGISLKSIKKSIKFGLDELKNFKDRVVKEGKRVLEHTKKNKLLGIVLAYQPYHIDERISHSIDKLLNSLGFVVLLEDCFDLKKVKTKILNQWSYHAKTYSVAKEIIKNDYLELVHLVSFGCGIDAITADEAKDILNSNDKFYTQIKIDEVSNLGGAKIRLRSLKFAMEEKLKLKGLL